MAARDYPPENPGEFQPTPGKARPREHGVAAGDGVTLGQKILGWSRWLLTALTVVYCVLYLVVLYGMEHEAENSQFFSVAMYAPPWVWLLPIIPLGALAIFVYARLLIPLALCVPVMIFGFMDLRWNSHVSATGRAFKVVTNNIGQDHKKSYTSFADLQKADIIALQDANPTVHGKQAAEHYPNHHVAAKDQFVLISKYPIHAADVLPMPDPADPRHRVAAWFELEVEGRPLLVFMLHMPTPRQEIMAVKSPSAILGMLGKSTGNSGALHEQNERFFLRQLELARQMVQITRAAKAPFIVCGDFNVPTHGHCYRLYRENWREAFSERGQGVGATFPGDAHFPAWLRLDNIYCSQTGLRPIHAEAESDRGSQHRAMAASFEFIDARR
ncbi:MAG: hypothetical protein EB141_08945 [Verrucomicrobia bacterium]|nr:hypothetical protein [Verrucomicrobiota bacterium]NBU07938.1 hypothetical protein [Pseudomonadota bacterium]NDA65882.1 hypothetical protein [Verrucomicrobiota bacterium]NDB75754.1 hypothetical protein [Verrucomicrobiota bacterium]NDD37359.1 hypothetical protein [Verrucomicrobiota bacterium]